MAGTPRKRARLEAEAAGDLSREAPKPLTAPLINEIRQTRQQRDLSKAADRLDASGTKDELREKMLAEFWPMAETVVRRALRGEEINREQLNTAFRILDQQFGKPGQTKAEVLDDQPTAIVYESAVFDAQAFLKKPDAAA
jgi:hypothetical protein